MADVVSDAPLVLRAIENPTRRRGVFAMAGAVIGGLAILLEKTAAQATHGNGKLGSPCCNLATEIWCPYQVSRDRWWCSSGYYRTIWSCTTHSGRLVWCGECSATTNCHYGPWQCSIWFYN